MPSSVYVGIDVACASGKRLPICVVSANRPLMPLSIREDLAALVPRGTGNREITAVAPFEEAARNVASAMKCIAGKMGWQIERIALDAPAAPPATDSRKSEDELGKFGLSSFRTPSETIWADIREKCHDHLGRGGSLATLPYANKIWMLFGFKVFAALKSGLGAEIIEVYPFAIVRTLLPTCKHKSTEDGYRDQLAAVAARTGWEPRKLEAKLKDSGVSGNRHDRLDAFMAAWVASLPPRDRQAFGDAYRPDDAIWVPTTGTPVA